MKVSTSWMSKYLDFPLPATDELVKLIGAQLGEVESVQPLAIAYKDIVVVAIKTVKPVAGSDHLKECWIDVGDFKPSGMAVERNQDGLICVVTGASNVREGMVSVWLPPGSSVPSSHFEGEPFILTKRPFLGIISNGMLGSPKELAISDEHEGLIELESDLATPGTLLIDLLELNDTIITIENKMFTHRPDCFGQLGVARELAGILHKQFSSPAWYLNGRTEQEMPTVSDSRLSFRIENELPSAVPSIRTVILSAVSGAQKSPLWLQSYLYRLGLKPRNLLVDCTNYLMVLTGQPLHCYDYDKFLTYAGDSDAFVVRNPRPDETITLINGKTITPRPEAIMIATGDTLLGLGGIMGGQSTEVDASTTRVILEVANFDMYSVRKTAMAAGVTSDALTRFNKGQSPLQTEVVLKEAMHLLHELSTTKVQCLSPIVSDEHGLETMQMRHAVHPPIAIDPQFISDRLGRSFQANELIELLSSVECQVTAVDSTIRVLAPFWRTDIELREDIVEEVGRLYGYDNLPSVVPQRSLRPAERSKTLDLKAAIRRSLARSGANEILSYSFVHQNLLEKASQTTEDTYRIQNALSPDLQYYRYTALPSLLQFVRPNLRAGFKNFCVYELSKGHSRTAANDPDGVPAESDRLDICYVSEEQKPGAAFYYLRTYLDFLLKSLGLEAQYSNIIDLNQEQQLRPFHPERTAAVSIAGRRIGYVGELDKTVQKNFKLPSYCAAASLDLSQIDLATDRIKKTYTQLSRFPYVEQDICLRLGPTSHSYAEVYETVSLAANQVLKPNQFITIEPIDIYCPDTTQQLQFTFRLRLGSYERTLTEADLSAIIQKVSASAEQHLETTVI